MGGTVEQEISRTCGVAIDNVSHLQDTMVTLCSGFPRSIIQFEF